MRVRYACNACLGTTKEPPCIVLMPQLDQDVEFDEGPYMRCLFEDIPTNAVWKRLENKRIRGKVK